jgi:uncharacterized protein (TIGR00369 family)
MSAPSITATDAELAELVRRARQEEDPGLLVRALPFCVLTGISFEKDEAGSLIGVLPYADHLIGDSSIPALHGGTLCTLLETTAVFHVLWAARDAPLPKTITATVDYLRSGRPVDTRCRAEIVRLGRRIAVVSARAYQDDPSAPIATAIIHILIASAPEPG